jgi:hypothetical protein
VAKITKAQKKRLAKSIYSKTVKLYTSGDMTMSDVQKIMSICQRSLVKAGYNKSDLY